MASNYACNIFIWYFHSMLGKINFQVSDSVGSFQLTCVVWSCIII